MQRSPSIHDAFNIFGLTTSGEPRKDIGALLSSVKSWLLFLVVVVIYIGIILAGNFLGRQRLLEGIHEPETVIETAVGAVLGLLAFLLGFTFSLTWSRFANRNIYVVQHAKAITVCYLRAGLLPEKQKEHVRMLLQEYLSILLHIQTAPDLQEALTRISQIHHEIWQQTETLVTEDIDSELRSLFIGSVNDLINVAIERKTVALFIRIPNAIWLSLLILGLIGMLAFGYQSGTSGIIKLFQLPLLPLAFGLVIVLISDLNSQSAQRHFKVTKQPLVEVLEVMKKMGGK